MQPHRIPNLGYDAIPAPTRTADVDKGLRAFMLGVYHTMVLGLVVTGLVAFGLSMLAFTGFAGSAARALGGEPLRLSGQHLTATGALLFATQLKWVVMLAPLAFVFLISFRMERMSAASARASTDVPRSPSLASRRPRQSLDGFSVVLQSRVGQGERRLVRGLNG